MVRARDPQAGPKPSGKQSPRYENYGCMYTRTTGIWQTVWLEPVPAMRLGRPRITPDVSRGLFHLQVPVAGATPGAELGAADAGRRRDHRQSDLLGSASTSTPASTCPSRKNTAASGARPTRSCTTWRSRVADADGVIVDRATSYAGLRGISIEGPAIKLNGQPLFQRLVLDQGFYPDGIFTAPTDEALRRDIELSMAAGFNGARLHQKVFEERFLYHADRLGYLVWGEFADWGCNGFGPDGDNQQPGATYITQWLEALERDYSHPAIVGWCPLNETWQLLTDKITVLDDVTRGMFLATKAMDQTRPVLDTSGYSHRVPEADVYDSHNYEQDPAKFARA